MGAGSEASFLPVLAGLTIPPALYLLGTYLYHSKPSYQYSIQAGKKINTNACGKKELGGTLSREFIVADNLDIRISIHSVKTLRKMIMTSFWMFLIITIPMM